MAGFGDVTKTREGSILSIIGESSSNTEMQATNEQSKSTEDSKNEKDFKDTNESSEIDMTKPFGLFCSGGSIGTKKAITNRKGDVLVDTYFLLDDARDAAKRRNKILSPGERKYYGISYYAAPMGKLQVNISNESSGSGEASGDEIAESLAKVRERAGVLKRESSVKTSWKNKINEKSKSEDDEEALYGPSGSKTLESLSSVLSILDNYREGEDNLELSSEDYEGIKESIANYMTSVMADDGVTNEEIYESILFNVAPIMAVIETVADNEGVFEEVDLENLDKYIDYLENEELADLIED